MPSNTDERKYTFTHILWIGGPPDAGKSTVADLLGSWHGLPVYHFDRHEMAHIARADPIQQPELHRLGAKLRDIGELAWVEEDWIRAEPDEMARRTIRAWTERVGLAVDDLTMLPTDRPVIAEGPGFFPEALLPLLAHPRQAIFPVPTRAFKLASHERRGKSHGRAERTSDPDRYRHNHITRDLLLADHYRRSAHELGLRAITIDGAQSAAQVAKMVEEHFGLGAPL
jgi:hypothetical protein